MTAYRLLSAFSDFIAPPELRQTDWQRQLRQRKRRLSDRRGATAVLVAVLIVLVGATAAFAIDLARVYTGVNEMQTAADAAALAGAIQFQRSGTSPVSAVQTFAGNINNKAFGNLISLPASDVEGGSWDPVTGVFTSSASWATSNAVRVTTRSTPAMSFGALMGRSSVSATRRAVAWVANQSTRDCIKPWGIDVAYLNTLLTNAITTQAGIAELRSRTSTTAGQQALTVIAAPDGNTAGNTAPTRFQALTGNNSSRRQYQNAIIDQACDNTSDYSANTVTQVQPGNGGGDVPHTTVNAVELTLNGNQGQWRSADMPRTDRSQRCDMLSAGHRTSCGWPHGRRGRRDADGGEYEQRYSRLVPAVPDNVHVSRWRRSG